MNNKTYISGLLLLALSALTGCDVYVTPYNYSQTPSSYVNRTKFLAPAVLYGNSDPQASYRSPQSFSAEHYIRPTWQGYQAPRNGITNGYTTTYRQTITNQTGQDPYSSRSDQYRIRTQITKTTRKKR